jgi:hypothetical protein
VQALRARGGNKWGRGIFEDGLFDQKAKILITVDASGRRKVLLWASPDDTSDNVGAAMLEQHDMELVNPRFMTSGSRPLGSSKSLADMGVHEGSDLIVFEDGKFSGLLGGANFREPRKAEKEAKPVFEAAVRKLATDHNLDLEDKKWKRGKSIAWRAIIDHCGVQAQFTDNLYYKYLVMASEANKDATADSIEVVEAAIRAAGKNPEELLKRGTDNRVLNLLEAAQDFNVADKTGYLQSLARKAEGCESAYEIVKNLLEERGEAPLKMNSRGRIIGLLDAAMRLEVVNQDPYLRQRAREAEGCESAYEIVKNLLEERGEAPLKMNSRGQVIGLLDAAMRLEVVNQDPYLRQRARAAEGCESAYKIVKNLLKERGEAPLKMNSRGQVIGLLDAAMRLEVVNQDPYLRERARKAEGCESAYKIVKNLLKERGEAPLKTDSLGRVMGLLDVATRLEVVNQDAYLRKLARARALTLMEAEAANMAAAKDFEDAGEDKALSHAERKQMAKELIAHYLPEFGTAVRKPLCQVYEASGERGKSKESDETVSQFSRACFKDEWETCGEMLHESAGHFEHHILYETNNPPNAFGIEKEMHEQIAALGAKHPTERLFQKMGSGGFNPKYHYDGKNYGVYLLVRRGGPPPHWRRV